MSAAPTSVRCDYCGGRARFHSTSSHIYGRDFGPVWDCRPCDAFVGCHPDGMPKGTLAQKTRREARKLAHFVFDHLWQDWRLAYPDATRQSSRMKQVMRLRAYAWLAHHLGTPIEKTHIAMFDELQCLRVVEVMQAHAPTARTVREWAKRKGEQLPDAHESIDSPRMLSPETQQKLDDIEHEEYP